MASKKGFRCALRISLISILSLLLLAILALAVSFTVALLPRHLTPLANNLANKYLNAEVKIEKVELTFFSTFPHIGLELQDGLVVSRALRDSAFRAEDTLLRFESCVVDADFKAWRKEKRLLVRNVRLEGANVFLYTAADSACNYMIFVEKEAADTGALALPPIHIARFDIENSDVCLEDVPKCFYARAEALALGGEARYDTARIWGDFSLSMAGLSVSKDSQPIVKNLPLELITGAEFNHHTLKGSLTGAALRVQQFGLGLDGGFALDSAGNIHTNLTVALQSNSLQEVLNLIPQKYLQTQGVEADGEVDLQAYIYGTYGHGRMPQMRLKLSLVNGRARYAGMPIPIDTIHIRLNAYIDPNKDSASYVNLEELSLMAQDVEVLAECKVNTLLTDPHIDFKFSSDLDLGMLRKMLPLRPGLAMGGWVNVDMDGKFALSDAQSGNLGKIKARGKFLLSKVFYNDSVAKTFVDADAKVILKDGKYLGGYCQLNRIHCALPGVRAYVDSMVVKALSQIPEKNPAPGAIIPVKASVQYSRLFASYNDSLRVFSEKSKMLAWLKPDPDKPSRPRVEVRFETDSLFARRGGYKARLTAAKVNATLTKTRRNEWWPLVNANLTRISVTMPQLSEPLQIRKFKGVLNGNDLEIEKARFRLGESRLRVSGKVWDVAGIVRNNGRIRADLDLSSRMIDCNNILNIALKSVDEAALEKEAVRQFNERESNDGEPGESGSNGRESNDGEPGESGLNESESNDGEPGESGLNESGTNDGEPGESGLNERESNERGLSKSESENESDEVADNYEADTLQGMRLFEIPENWDLHLKVDAERVYYDRMIFDSIKGQVHIRNRAVNLRDFTMRSWGADMRMNLVYANRGGHYADVGADVGLDDIRIDSLIGSFPSLDTTLPMLRAFEGIVDLEATASARLDSNISVLLPSLTAALRLHGDSLVVLDGETFATIAHYLSFENKDRNLIDSLSATVTVQDGLITFHPFILKMDRCKVAAGGYQNMDMSSFRYHITLLEAPWYVKALTRGVNIIGNPNKKRGFSIKTCAPIYKDAFTPEKVRQVDETRLNLGRQIMWQFEGWMNRERRKMDKVVIPRVEITDSI